MSRVTGPTEIMCDNTAPFWMYHQWVKDDAGVTRCRVCAKTWERVESDVKPDCEAEWVID